MDVIQLLPDSVANQIAAGEVIQRPASVVKELVENAVDAGATEINVIIVDAGRTSIQVIDNGKGMSETDARLAFERHATSKIRQADDLFSLHTMGFRGEALPSIAAVSQVELRTRQANDTVGTHLRLSASKVVSQEPVSCAVGSNFSIENLFFNVPARRKFLKSNTTEMNNILTAFERIVLVYPQVVFTLFSNGTEVFNLQTGGLLQRIVDVFGKRVSQDLLPVKVDTTMCRISGYVGKPDSARKKGAHQYFFVNGRYMKHPYFHRAVQSAFDRMVPAGEQVPYFLYFDVAPADIDVNIHPTKTEIKFENEQPIFQILTAAVREAVGRFSDIPSIDFDTEGKPDIPSFGQSAAAAAPKVSYNPQYNPFKTEHTPRQTVAKDWQRLYDNLPAAHHDEAVLFGGDEAPATPAATAADTLLADKSPSHYQYKGRFIMTAVKSGLMVIDQHRAHVRILYEEYMRQLSNHSGSSQKVLFPEVVHLTPNEQNVFLQVMPDLVSLGFELTDMGGGSYAVNAVPANLDGVNIVTLVTSMVAAAAGKGASVADEVRGALAASLARNAAIPVGQVLSNDEMENLVNQLFACQNVNYTPDGKPVLGILQQREIEQLLG